MQVTSGAGRWVLLLALAAGLIGMHHLEAGPEAPPPVAVAASMHAAEHVVGAGMAMDGMAMDGMAMHQCLAVLAAVGLLGLLLLVVAVLPRGPVAPPSRAVVRTPARPPPRSAVRLALLCVLRN